MNADRSLKSPQQVALSTELQALGRLLDTMDQGKAPMSNRQYRRAAVRAAEILSTNEDLMPLRRVCTTSSALRELLSNELMTRAAAKGEMRWLHSCRF